MSDSSISKYRKYFEYFLLITAHPSYLDNGGWESWFQGSTHEATARLYKKMEFVGSLEEGIGNVTQSFFWNYAFLGPKARLEYLVQSNYSNE